MCKFELSAVCQGLGPPVSSLWHSRAGHRSMTIQMAVLLVILHLRKEGVPGLLAAAVQHHHCGCCRILPPPAPQVSNDPKTLYQSLTLHWLHSLSNVLFSYKVELLGLPAYLPTSHCGAKDLELNISHFCCTSRGCPCAFLSM